ncbi:hypothetical protein V8Z69_18340 [Microbacterium aurugineum]|uniref:hypothetical protein n=1 Tax=Microbacterium aurugineum TaxID=2851642 RepID=UPI0039BE6FFB
MSDLTEDTCWNCNSQSAHDGRCQNCGAKLGADNIGWQSHPAPLDTPQHYGRRVYP